MNIDTAAIDDAVLALLYLTVHDRNRAWKSFDGTYSTDFMNAASSANRSIKRDP
ncbi:conserved protein of unknown function [Burkholderia multivorans]